MALAPEQMEGLWGDGGPYSQVQVIREVRILDDRVTRTLFYVKANVNPTTYATLKAMERLLADPEILDFLRNATFVSEEEGYEWAVYGGEADTAARANRAANRVRDAIIRMHHLIMESMAALEGAGRPGPGTSEPRWQGPPQLLPEPDPGS